MNALSGGAVRPGDVLAGKYRVERVLGAGGMGVVVAAWHLALDERVALKFLLPQALASAEAVARFDREARAAVKIKSEHVARILDVGRLETGAPYIVMEYLDGSDLAAWVRSRGALDVEQAVEFVLQACEALAEAHALGIVHRDLKPANLYCIRRADGLLAVKVLDFGISKVTGPDGQAVMTSTHAIVGSPLYMSPEQLQSSRGVDARTDIWSLGVILFELLTGRRPFEAEAVTELVIKIATEPAPPVRSLRADVPPGLEHAVMRCLEKDRARRFQSVGDLAVALRDHAPARARPSADRILRTLQTTGRPTAPAPVPAGAPLPASTTPMTDAPWIQTGSKRRPRRTVLAIALGAVVAAAGMIALFFARAPPKIAPRVEPAVALAAAPSAIAAPLASVVPPPSVATDVRSASPDATLAPSDLTPPDAGSPAHSSPLPAPRAAVPAPVLPRAAPSSTSPASPAPASPPPARSRAYDHM